jgi:predicted signal transduction protein with EAL and GGDEF domain
LLKQVAVRLQGAVREVDLVTRLGGDEFAVLLPRVGSLVSATMVAERIHEALSMPVELNGTLLEVGASVGVSVYPADASDAEQLLQHADVAMYVAKRSRLGVTVYDADLDESSPDRLTVVSDLRHALDRAEIVLHYQPKADAHTGRICGVEALARWQHPTRGLLGPFEFIPVAEENGLIQPLTRYVLDVALDQCRQWLSTGVDLPVSVNVGAECLQNASFPTQVAEALARHDVPPHKLTLEITESGIITNAARAAEVLAALGNQGVRLSIDDFGTGYSSIAMLRNLPVHELKLDRTFVTQMRSSVGNTAIVRALLDLGRNFDLQVVAEGIEDGDTWTELESLGCHVIQGFYLAKPMPAAEIQPWLDRGIPDGPDSSGDPVAAGIPLDA